MPKPGNQAGPPMGTEAGAEFGLDFVLFRGLPSRLNA